MYCAAPIAPGVRVAEPPRRTGRGDGAELTLDPSAIAANTRFLAARATRLMAVVKADGFGHGAAEAAAAALGAGATSLGVTSVEEALVLRAAGFRVPILSWLNPVDGAFEEALRAHVSLAVPGCAHLTSVVRAASRTRRTARIHLQLDTGMGRDGAEPEAWPELCRRARQAEADGLAEVVGVMSHLGCAETPGDPCTDRALDLFRTAVSTAAEAGLRPRRRHLAATSATLTDSRTRFDLARVGAGLFGIDPTGTTRLRPALTLTAPVVAVRAVPAGAGAGYGHSWSAERRTHLALLPVGYADGLPRSASARAEVLLGGRRCRIAGRISMDQVIVDTGDRPAVPGETATVFGPGDRGEPTVREWARWSGTLEHEIMTGLGARLRRSVRRQAVAA
ncbi:alanine racemase [Peterkaempfera griseoplana]|uniref:alanine racemase n=1 Tax=Peterkaempfera griseoplana TaxID=66896 RepID=UPI0006E2D512|nr:alanine racemase [Peterkaempfera griseoplana]